MSTSSTSALSGAGASANRASKRRLSNGHKSRTSAAEKRADVDGQAVPKPSSIQRSPSRIRLTRNPSLGDTGPATVGTPPPARTSTGVLKGKEAIGRNDSEAAREEWLQHRHLRINPDATQVVGKPKTTAPGTMRLPGTTPLESRFRSSLDRMLVQFKRSKPAPTSPPATSGSSSSSGTITPPDPGHLLALATSYAADKSRIFKLDEALTKIFLGEYEPRFVIANNYDLERVDSSESPVLIDESQGDGWDTESTEAAEDPETEAATAAREATLSDAERAKLVETYFRHEMMPRFMDQISSEFKDRCLGELKALAAKYPKQAYPQVLAAKFCRDDNDFKGAFGFLQQALKTSREIEIDFQIVRTFHSQINYIRKEIFKLQVNRKAGYKEQITKLEARLAKSINLAGDMLKKHKSTKPSFKDDQDLLKKLRDEQQRAMFYTKVSESSPLKGARVVIDHSK